MIKLIFVILIAFSLLVKSISCNFSGFLEKLSQLFISELSQIHIINLESLDELTLYSYFQITRLSMENLENRCQVQEIAENQEYNIFLTFENPRGVIGINQDQFKLPIFLRNFEFQVKIKKLANKQAFRAVSLNIEYEDISFDLGYLGYVIPDTVLRGKSMREIFERAENRLLVAYNKFLRAFDFMMFKDDRMVIDMEILFEQGDLLQQEEEVVFVQSVEREVLADRIEELSQQQQEKLEEQMQIQEQTEKLSSEL
ncbi:hypothetical protein PPERSA_08327 [Pseudocohnilembus persalinus]|uniref:Uncharacterized protein n=1 Tax=Pseudocohnilembus persalinus TaxID=266149 RepID=A0A0V0QQ54_PSEPJ|nr:hypothetical protein PPERSA_08327 [Pseudocohnilembus persalinus]|eukprot:KRX04112.1 hypothetical protein PPERSA_08327 [Pseudocohnilembus persalinus]